ncbi:MAG: hypothetical protein ABIT76_04905 [Chthoniobacterales bacterium]
MSDPENSAPESNALDLRFLPSWLKEENSAPANYANFDGEDRAPRRGGRDGGGDFRRGPRPAQGGGGGRDQNSRNSQRPSGPQGGGGSRPPQSNPSSRPPENRGPRRDSGRPDNRDRRNGPPDRRQEQRPPQPEERPAKVSITFLPEQHALEKVTEQLKSAPIAYPLFGVAKMFLQRPERHHVVIKPLPESKLFKLQNTSHFATERGRLESIAFQELWKNFFRVEVTEAPEIKGNFASVARSRLTGKIFGPTNHHSFQPALHKEYEERFSRRMSFQEYKSNIETTNNPEAVEQWKTESRRLETYLLLTPGEQAELSAPKAEVQPVTESYVTPEEPVGSEVVTETTVVNTTELSVHTDETPVLEETPAETPVEEAPADEAPIAEPPASSGLTFASKSEAEAYFRKEILPNLITEVEAETLTGQEARNLTDRRLTASVRMAWEAEMRYPLGLVNAIRVKFNEQNLHIFKFKKRVLLISSLKPSFLDDRSESLSSSIRTVLQTIHAHPGIDRKGLAEKILGNNVGATDDEKLSLKHSLIGDLYWLIRQGHVIEFSDGTFDLPMGPKAIQAEAAAEAKAATETPRQETTAPVEASSPESQEQ